MAEENQDQIQEEKKGEGLIADTPITDEPKETDPNDTVVPHKEEEKPQQPVETKEEEKTLEKPEYLENKFWDEKSGVKVEELNNSYKEYYSLWMRKVSFSSL